MTPFPTKLEAVNLFIQLLEKVFRTKTVSDKLKPDILKNIVPQIALNFASEDVRGLDRLKSLVLKEFQPTAVDCLNILR